MRHGDSGPRGSEEVGVLGCAVAPESAAIATTQDANDERQSGGAGPVGGGQQVINSPEVLEVMHELGVMDTYLNAFYDGRYREFFGALGMAIQRPRPERGFRWPHR